MTLLARYTFLLFFTFLFGTTPFFLFSQTTFSRYYDLNRYYNDGWAIESDNETIFIRIGTFCDIPDSLISCHGSARFDGAGNLIWLDTTAYWRTWGQEMLQTDSSLALMGYDSNTEVYQPYQVREYRKTDGALIGIDTLGSDSIYEFPYLQNYATLPDGYLFSSRLDYPGNDRDSVRLVFTDRNFTYRFERLMRYEREAITPTTGEIVADDAGFIYGSSSYIADTAYVDADGFSRSKAIWGQVTKFDSNLQVQWSVRLGLDNQFSISHRKPQITLLSNGNIAAYWVNQSHLTMNTLKERWTIYSISPEGGIQGRFQYDHQYDNYDRLDLLGLVGLQNGDFLLYGALDNRDVSGEFTGEKCGYLARFSNSAELRWERILCDDGGGLPADRRYAVIFDCAEMPNGDIALTGDIRISRRLSDPNGNPNTADEAIWLARVDSLGCLEPGCQDDPSWLVTDVSEPALPTPAERAPRLWPNPAAWGVLHLSLPGGSASGTWYLFDGLGRGVGARELRPGAETTFSTDELPTGLYYWSWRGRDGTTAGGKVVVE